MAIYFAAIDSNEVPKQDISVEVCFMLKVPEQVINALHLILEIKVCFLLDDTSNLVTIWTIVEICLGSASQNKYLWCSVWKVLFEGQVSKAW